MNSEENTAQPTRSRLRPPQMISRSSLFKDPNAEKPTEKKEIHFHDPLLASLSSSIENSKNSVGSFSKMVFSPVKPNESSFERRLSTTSSVQSCIRKPRMSLSCTSELFSSPSADRRMTISSFTPIRSGTNPKKENENQTSELLHEHKTKEENSVLNEDMNISSESSFHKLSTPHHSMIPPPKDSKVGTICHFSFKPRDQLDDHSSNLGYNTKRSKNGRSEDSFQQLNESPASSCSKDHDMNNVSTISHDSLYTTDQYMNPIQIQTTQQIEQIVQSGYVPLENPLTYSATNQMNQILEDHMNNGDLLRKTLCLRVRAPNTDVKERIRELNEILVDHKQCLRTLSDSKSMYIHTSYRVE